MNIGDKVIYFRTSYSPCFDEDHKDDLDCYRNHCLGSFPPVECPLVVEVLGPDVNGYRKVIIGKAKGHPIITRVRVTNLRCF